MVHRIYPKEWLRLFLLEAFRTLERMLPTTAAYALFYPFAFDRARRLLQPPLRSWPTCLGWPTKVHAPFRRATREQADNAMAFLADRLSLPRWQRRCHIVGLDRLMAARRNGPVVLAFMHTGPYYITGYWLRAHGIPAATLRLGSIRDRSRLRRYNDGHLPFPTIPSILYMDQLRTISRIFSDGGTLMVAIDGWGKPPVRLVDIPLTGGGTRPMSTGAVRLAAKYGAALLPCSIVEEGRWRYHIELGHAVPGEYLTGEPDFFAAGKHLFAELLPHRPAVRPTPPDGCLTPR